MRFMLVYCNGMQPHQVIVIHGSDVTASLEEYTRTLEIREVSIERLRPRADWKQGLQAALGGGFDVLTPHMPLTGYAPYDLWKLWFSRCTEVFADEVTLVGHSLGGILLAKFFADGGVLRSRVRSLHLVAAPFGFDEASELPEGWWLPRDLSELVAHATHAHLYHSTDDPVVPYAHAAQYHEALPGSTLHTFHDRGHFLQGEFPELVRVLTQLTESDSASGVGLR